MDSCDGFKTREVLIIKYRYLSPSYISVTVNVVAVSDLACMLKVELLAMAEVVVVVILAV